MVNKQKTYACIIATIISSNVMNIIINIGKRLRITRPFTTILKANPDKIAKSKCPAEMFAANRIPSDMALIIKLNVSIITSTGASALTAVVLMALWKPPTICTRTFTRKPDYWFCLKNSIRP